MKHFSPKILIVFTIISIFSCLETQAGFLAGIMGPKNGKVYYQCGGMTQTLVVKNYIPIRWGAFDLEKEDSEYENLEKYSYTVYNPYSNSYQTYYVYTNLDKSSLIVLGVGRTDWTRINTPPADSHNGSYSKPNNSYNYNNSNDNSTRSRSTRRTCPGCNGTGKGHDEIIYAPNYTGNDNSRYCSQCGRTMSAHTHHQKSCTVCHGRGYVE